MTRETESPFHAREVNLTHEDMEWIARFAEQFVIAVGRFGGYPGMTSLNEEAAFNALCHAVDFPKSRARQPGQLKPKPVREKA